MENSATAKEITYSFSLWLFTIFLFFGFLLSPLTCSLALTQEGENTIADRIKALAPDITLVSDIQPCRDSYENTLWSASTNRGRVVLRSKKSPHNHARFQEIVSISQACYKAGIAPKVLGRDLFREEFLLQYIEHEDVLKIPEIERSQKLIMKLLRKLHTEISSDLLKEQPQKFVPFNLIHSELNQLDPKRLGTVKQ